MKKKGTFVRFNKDMHKKNSVGCKPDFKKIATTRHLTRILTYLSSVNYANQNRIQSNLGIENNYVKDALNFLVNRKMVLSIKLTGGSNVHQYVINPLFRK